MPARRPHVVAHVAVSLDGATTGFEPDVGRFYELARTWSEDVTLAGADTVLAQEEALAAAPRPGPAADAPLLAVVDGRGRVRQWEALRDCGHWSGVIALRAFATAAPANHGPRAGALHRRGARRPRRRAGDAGRARGRGGCQGRQRRRADRRAARRRARGRAQPAGPSVRGRRRDRPALARSRPVERDPPRVAGHQAARRRTALAALPRAHALGPAREGR